jgi:transcriptional regulator with XRE-family HTH domain
MASTDSAQPIPAAARETLRGLGQGVRTARLKRRWAQALLAEKAGVSTMTLRNLEQGKPGVGLGTYVTVLWALGLDDLLAPLADPAADLVGVTLSSARLGSRVRAKRELDDDF